MYYLIQITNTAGIISIVLLLYLLVGFDRESVFMFKNRRRILGFLSCAVLMGINAAALIGRGTSFEGFVESSTTVAKTVDFIAVMFAMFVIHARLKKSKQDDEIYDARRYITIPASELDVYNDTTVLGAFTLGTQHGIWDNGKERITLIFDGARVSELHPDDTLVLEVVPKENKQEELYVLDYMLTKKRNREKILARIGTAACWAARVLVVISWMMMTHDLCIGGTTLPFPEGHPSLTLFGGSIGFLLFQWVFRATGPKETGEGMTLFMKCLRLIVFIMMAMSALTVLVSFADCLM